MYNIYIYNEPFETDFVTAVTNILARRSPLMIYSTINMSRIPRARDRGGCGARDPPESVHNFYRLSLFRSSPSSRDFSRGRPRTYIFIYYRRRRRRRTRPARNGAVTKRLIILGERYRPGPFGGEMVLGKYGGEVDRRRKTVRFAFTG